MENLCRQTVQQKLTPFSDAVTVVIWIMGQDVSSNLYSISVSGAFGVEIMIIS